MQTDTIFKIALLLLILAFAARRNYYVSKHGAVTGTIKKREESRHYREYMKQTRRFAPRLF